MGYEGSWRQVGVLPLEKAVWLIRLYLISQFRSNTISDSRLCQQRFSEEGETLIPFEKFVLRYTGESLLCKPAEFSRLQNGFNIWMDEVEKITELRDFGRYLTAMLEIDAFFSE